MSFPGDQEAERAGHRLLRGLISESRVHLKGSSTGRSAAALAGRLPEAAQPQRLHGGALGGGMALHLFVSCVMFVCGLLGVWSAWTYVCDKLPGARRLAGCIRRAAVQEGGRLLRH